MASFGASAVLLFSDPSSNYAQPRNLIGGHLVSAAAGVLVCQTLGAGWWSVALAVSLAVLFMRTARVLHPPGGVTAIIAAWNHQGYLFILEPVLLGSVLLVAMAYLIHNFHCARKYPKYWWRHSARVARKVNGVKIKVVKHG